MPEIDCNGARLYYELEGSGEPLALVHGSWVDSNAWLGVLPHLARTFQVLRYDRRGHSRSQSPDTPGSVDEDGDDLAALLEALDLAPAHVMTSSFGGVIAIRLATRRPELFRSLTCHEPPLWGVVEDDPEAQQMLEQGAAKLKEVARLIAGGDHEGAARHFVEEVAFGPGAWDQLPAEVRATFVRNAPTYLDEMQDPTQTSIDSDALTRLEMPVRLTNGTESPPIFPRVVDRLAELIPNATRETFEGASHAPQLTMPERYAEATAGALKATAA